MKDVEAIAKLCRCIEFCMMLMAMVPCCDVFTHMIRKLTCGLYVWDTHVLLNFGIS